MNSLLLFLLKSTLSLSLLYIAYRLLMHRETFFKLNRTVLLLAVLYSMTIPFLYSPKLLTVQPELKPVFQHVNISEEPIQVLDEPVTVPQSPPILVRETIRPVALSVSAIFTIVYLTGVFISLVLLVYSINRVLLLFRKARQTNLNGIRLMVVAEDIPTFSFGRNILISQQDYENNFEAIITHELSHIRLGHFYDLMLMELVKIVFWFNPLVYRIMHDLKEIHEFQADDQALNSGIDATKYQLLIIQKSVGQQRFALANSFNHCQIKNRIVMMNKQKTSKAWRWKVATFLPLLALLLMAFGKPGEKDPLIGNQSSIKAGAERNNLLITFNSNGKVLINISGLDNRQQLLTKMGEIYHIDFSPEELKEFSSINSFGVPMKVMKVFLDMRPEEKDKPQNKLGIPFNSPGNEFKNWVATARTVAGKEMKITIKGDQSASYPAIKKIIGTLRDLNEDKFNLITEQPTVLEQPKAIEQPKFIKPPREQIKIRASRAVTIILDKDNSVYYYVGARDTKTGIDPVVTKTDFSSSGIHKFLINKNYDVVAKIEDLKKKKQELNLSEEAFEQQRKEIISDKNALVVLIKSTDDAKYGNLINILDEMALCSIGRFAIVDISGYDKNLMKKAKIELNPPAFSVKNQK